MLAYLKGKLNLYEIDDMDIEEFRDVIYDLTLLNKRNITWGPFIQAGLIYL